jgi:hypothetical protein
MEENNKDIAEALKDAGGNFTFFITGLSMQALVSLGEIPNPVDNKKEKNLEHARYLIDTLDMIKHKTKGNLTKEEEKILDDILYSLRMKYMESSGKEKK